MDLQALLNLVEEFLTTPCSSPLLSPDQKSTDGDLGSSACKFPELPTVTSKNKDLETACQIPGPGSKGILSKKYFKLFNNVELAVPTPLLSPLEFDPKTILQDSLWGSVYESRKTDGTENSPEMSTLSLSPLDETSKAIEEYTEEEVEEETEAGCEDFSCQPSDQEKEVPNISQLLDCGKAVMMDLMNLSTSKMQLQEEKSQKKSKLCRKRKQIERQSSHGSKRHATMGCMRGIDYITARLGES